MPEEGESWKPAARFYLDYSKYKRWLEGKAPGYLKGTEEELIESLCRTYSLTEEEVLNKTMSFIHISQLINDKQAFLQWYAIKDN